MNKYIFSILILALSSIIIFSLLDKAKIKDRPEPTLVIAEPVLEASSSIAVLFTATSSKVLYSKNPNAEIPIASITKLFTAYVSTKSDLFIPLLVESSNAAAEQIADKDTINKMNSFAKSNGLKHTYFFNPSGLDRPGPNISSASDLSKAVSIMFETEHGKFIFNISKTITPNATNKSLTDPRIPFEIIGGKTGETPKAAQALVLITKGPYENSYIVFVVLGSKNRFDDMAILTNWAHDIFLPKKIVSKDPMTKMHWVLATSTAPWGTRDAHSIVTFKDKMYLIGGIDGNAAVESNGTVKYWEAPHKSDIWVTSDGKDWTLVTDKAPWKNRRSVTTAVFKNKLWLMGGWDQYDYRYDNKIWYTEDGENWILATSSTPRFEGREGHTLNVYDGKLWLMGGVNFVKRITYNDVWYSENGYDWVLATSSAPWTPRYDHAVSVFKDSLYLTGGLHINTHNTESEVWVSKNGIDWEHRVPDWPSRHGHISESYNNALWVIGGWNVTIDKGVNDTWFTYDGFKWMKTDSDGPWIGREDHMGDIFKGKMWVTGGMDTNEHWNSDVYYSEI